MKLERFFVLITALFVVACNNDKPQPGPPPDVERTLIIYMVADNNLISYANSNINAMEREFSMSFGTRVLLFFNSLKGESKLYDITHDTQPHIASPVVAQYSAETNPCLSATLSRVIADCRALSPTKSYSLVFWSHATGWLPQGMWPAKSPKCDDLSTDQVTVPQYTFGSTYSFAQQMEIHELAAALPNDLVFDFISFDACHMGAIEAAYELRDRTKYFIGSAAEILAEGYPYASHFDKMLSFDAIGVGESFFKHYDAKTGVYRSATTAVVATEKLEAVARQMELLVELGGTLRAEQQFGRYLGRSANFTDLFWDLADMAQRTWGKQAQRFLDALDQAVVYKGATPMLFENDPNGDIAVETFSGLSIYIPRLVQPQTLDIYTENYAWAKRTKLYRLAQ